jgi:hypothetical protein
MFRVLAAAREASTAKVSFESMLELVVKVLIEIYERWLALLRNSNKPAVQMSQTSI